MEYVRLAAPLLVKLKFRDRNLADQIERNENSMTSNLAEGASEDRPKVKADRYRVSKRETEECAMNWEKSVNAGHIEEQEINPLLSLLDEIARMLAGLIRRFTP